MWCLILMLLISLVGYATRYSDEFIFIGLAAYYN
jgi:hypothetical protein